MVIRRWRIVNAKEIMAQNIMRYLRSKGCSRNDLCHDLGFNYNTLADWIHARKYPRIEKIDAMARYFGVTRADLVELPRDRDGLTDEEQEMLMMYRSLNDESRAIIRNVIATYAENARYE